MLRSRLQDGEGTMKMRKQKEGAEEYEKMRETEMKQRADDNLPLSPSLSLSPVVPSGHNC